MSLFWSARPQRTFLDHLSPTNEKEMPANLRSGTTSATPLFGRRLQDGACSCEDNNDDSKPTTIRLLAVGGNGHYLDFIPNRFRSRADAFFERTGVTVQVIGLGDLEVLNEEILADTAAKVYDGYIFLPFLTGSLVERNGLADLTDFVAENEDVAWTDILPFNRDVQSVYDNTVRLIPCDGDVHSLFYRKDLFDQFDKKPPRTWDEYAETAAFFDGMEVMVGNDTQILSGSCVERKRSCHEPLYFNMLVHSTSTQVMGTKDGALFDPETFDPLMGEAMAETLRYLEEQVKYGDPEELVGDSCSGLNNDRMSRGTCAQTLFWGDVFARHLLEGSVLEGKLGIAQTPGVSRVLDRATGKMVECTEEICPHGITYDDIGRVSYAPYAAAGGWSAGVSAGVSPERQQAMAEFLGYACGKEESIEDVIPFARGELFTGTDPYRRSQFEISKWTDRGYPEEATVEYRDTILAELSSPNTVLDVRFPAADRFMNAMHRRIYDHLEESRRVQKSHEDRMLVAEAIAEEWRQITVDYDNSRASGALPLKSIYQKSLNVYTPPSTDDSSNLGAGGLAGVVIGCSLFVAIVAGALAWWLIRRERQKSSNQWVLRREELRLTSEILGEGSYGVIVKGYIRGTPVAVKTSRHTLVRLDSGAAESGLDSGSSQSPCSSRITATQLREDLAALVKLRSPHLTQVVGAMIDKKTVFVALEFMEYGSLASVLSDAAGIASNDGKQAFEMQWAIQIARGLDYLHTVPPPLGPLLHSELRASNIMVDSSYNAKISNFALEARVIGSAHDQGYLLWTAPEVLNGAPCSTSSDVYSYGMILYEIVSRSRPFRVRRFSSSNLTDYTASTLTDGSEDITSGVASRAFGSRAVEYFGEDCGERRTVPELVSRVSDLTLEPPCRPELPPYTPYFVRDICIECWNKNPSRRPVVREIVDRLSRDVSPSSLTKQLVERSSVFNSILPHDVQEKLARNETVPPRSYDNVTVIFSDIVGFTATSSLLTAEEVGDLIRRIFTKYDEVAEKYGVKKLDVIGDAFLGVAGIPFEEEDHASRAAAFALEAIEVASKTPICATKPQLGTICIRFGLATGPVVATVIGSSRHPKYTLFGTTVNTASRMESSSEPNRVQCTQETADSIKEFGPPGMGVHFRKIMDIKGRGDLKTYFLTKPSNGFGKFRRINPSKRNVRRSMGPLRSKQSSLSSSVGADMAQVARETIDEEHTETEEADDTES